MMAFVPMYFQVSAHASVTNAGAHLMPSVIGNAVGGLITGAVIRRLISPFSLMAPSKRLT
jgi:formate/nitrite transporter FocA (FNT family)